MGSTSTDLLLKRMFLARRVVLAAGAVLLVLLIAGGLAEHLGLLTHRGDELLGSAIWTVMLVIFGGTLVTSYYVFRAGLCEAGLKYAIGHMLLCVALTFMVPVIGIVFVPLLVHCDIDRWRRTEGELPDG